MLLKTAQVSQMVSHRAGQRSARQLATGQGGDFKRKETQSLRESMLRTVRKKKRK